MQIEKLFCSTQCIILQVFSLSLAYCVNVEISIAVGIIFLHDSKWNGWSERENEIYDDASKTINE